MTEQTQIQLLLLLPLVAVVLSVLFGTRPNLREAANLSVSVSLFGVALSLSSKVFSGARPEWVAWELLPELPFAFQLEPLGALFALVASGLWIMTTAYSIGYMRGHHETHQTRFYACFALAILAAMGAAASANLMTLFFFYELMTLGTYPLVTHHGTDAARRGGRVYLGLLMATSIGLLLLAIGWTWSVCGTTTFTPGGILSEPFRQSRIGRLGLLTLLGLFAYGTGKAALMPVHRWLPAAMVAPTPVSALLHAVAVVKVGVFTIGKILLYIFGLELLRETGINTYLAAIAGVSIICASLVALTKDNLKARLAYSTVSQLSYITLGMALADQWSVVGAGMHIVMHAVAKITLFFCAGAIYVATGKTEVSQMRGIGRRMPWTMGAFFIASLGIIGLPPLGGMWSKWYLAWGAVQADQPWQVAVLMVSSLMNIAYLLPVVAIAFFWPADQEANDVSSVGEAPLWCVVPLCLTAAMSVGLFFLAGRIRDVLLPLVGG